MEPIKQTIYLPVKVEDELPETGKKVFTFNTMVERGFTYPPEDDGENISINSRAEEIPNKCERWYDEHNFGMLYSKVNTWLKPQEGYFFTPEQLNQFVSDIVKDTLKTAVENAEISFLGGNSNINDFEIDKKSIFDTFEQTFNKHKV